MNATRHTFVTPSIVAANVAVFIAMCVRGVPILSPPADALIAWGAMYGPPATHGQWWRAVTAIFVHVGLVHLVMNMYVLIAGGWFVERLFGNLDFLVLYLAAGVGGSVTSLIVHPGTASAGASGAIFGIYGGLLSFVLLHRRVIAADAAAAMTKSAVAFLGINLLYGLANENVDVSAHVGGFVTGAAAGLLLATPLPSPAMVWRTLRAVVVTGAAIVAAITLTRSLPAVDDFVAEMKRVEAIEQASVAKYADALKKFRDGDIDSATLAHRVNDEVLPAWNAEQRRLAAANYPDRQRDTARTIARYMALRGEAWRLVVNGIAQDDDTMFDVAKAREAEAEAIAKSLGTSRDRRAR